MGNAVLVDPQGQTRLPVTGVRLSEAFNNALDMETSSRWREPQQRYQEIYGDVVPRPEWATSQEPARRAAFAEPGGQAPGVTANREALHRPLNKLQQDNQGASASGSSQLENLPEVSVGTKLVTARRAER